MALQERFDYIIECIEAFVVSGETDVPQALSTETGLNLRLLGDAFQFITDMTLIKYIRQRRLVHALTNRIEMNLPIEQVVSDSGFSDAAAFSKACKNEFNLSPSQITEAVLKQYPPLFFSRITSGKNGEPPEIDTLITTKKKETLCGISVEQFAEIKQVLELGSLYGLADEEAEFVYRLSQHCKITTALAAEFFEDFKLQIENGSYFGGHDLFEMAELACRYNLSFSETQKIIDDLKFSGYWSIHSLPDGFFDIYFCEENSRCGWAISYICEMLDAMEDSNLSLSEFTDFVFYADMFGTDIVDAIENFQKYQASWNEIVNETLVLGSSGDADEFGYRRIWEIPER